MNDLTFRLGQLFAAKLLFVAGLAILVGLTLLSRAAEGMVVLEFILNGLGNLVMLGLVGVMLHFYIALFWHWAHTGAMADDGDPFGPSKAFLVGVHVGLQRLRTQFAGYARRALGRTRPV